MNKSLIITKRGKCTGGLEGLEGLPLCRLQGKGEGRGKGREGTPLFALQYFVGAQAHQRDGVACPVVRTERFGIRHLL